jgi:integrase
MKRKYLRYCRSFEDRHGHVRYYFNRTGGKNIPLPGLPWSPTFMAAYEVALNGSNTVVSAPIKAKPGSVDAAVIAYVASDGFSVGLARNTRQTRTAILQRFRKEHGDKPVALMHGHALQNILNKKTPAAQRGFKKALRGFVNYCLSHGLMKTDPLRTVQLAKMKTTGIHTWTEEEIAQYETRHAAGSRARLALQLLLQTGHARSDVVRMGRQHIRGGKLSMHRQKTGVAFDIPVLPGLAAEIELHPRDQMTFLMTEYGKPFTAAGFGGWFRDRCDEADSPQCSAHGLRKASAVRHALAGATAPELMAWHGWKTLAEAQRYVEEANRIRLAESAGAKIIANVM